MNLGERRILTVLLAIEALPTVTQRLLARRAGAALGTVNSLVKSLLEREWVEYSSGNGEGYRLTPAGVAAKLRLLKLQLAQSLTGYVEVRDRIAGELGDVTGGRRKVVFYGAGVTAEIAFVAVARCGCELVGIVDDDRPGERFLNHTIASPSLLRDGHLNGNRFDSIVITSYPRADEIKHSLRRMNIDSSQVITILT